MWGRVRGKSSEHRGKKTDVLKGKKSWGEEPIKSLLAKKKKTNQKERVKGGQIRKGSPIGEKRAVIAARPLPVVVEKLKDIRCGKIINAVKTRKNYLDL